MIQHLIGNKSEITRWVRNSGHLEAFCAQSAAVAFPTSAAVIVCLIAGNSQRVIDAKSYASLHDIGLAEVLQRRQDTEALPLYAGLGRQVGHALERLDELWAAVRVAGIIHRVDADKDIAGIQHFCPAESQGQEYGVARRYIGDRDAFAGRFRHVDAAVGEGRAADAVEVQTN